MLRSRLQVIQVRMLEKERLIIERNELLAILGESIGPEVPYLAHVVT